MSHTLCAPVSRCHVLFPQIEPYMPYEFTCEGMLQRINAFIEKQVRPLRSPCLCCVLLPITPGGSHEQFKPNRISDYFLDLKESRSWRMACWKSKAFPVMVTQGSQSVCPWGKNALYDDGRPDGNL